jgi:2-octaprenyl-6-methoxyphenol hydroxylase
MNTDYDIVIVGGGMVGAALACALAPAGVRIASIEAVAPDADRSPIGVGDRQPSYDDRAIALAYGSRRIFEGIGVWSEIERLGAAPIERIHISDRGRFGFARLAAADLGREALGYVVVARTLGLALNARLAREPNVTRFCPATVEGCAVESDGARVTIRGGENTRELRARLVVGADGADSTVRRLAGIEASRSAYGLNAIVANVSVGTPHHNTAYERFTASGPLAVLPMADGRCTVVWSARDEEVPTVLGWSDEEFLAQLQDRFGERLGRLSRPGKRVAYPLALTRIAEHARPRLVLIGNAAHTVHPVAGQGFNLGLRDVAQLAEVLADAHRRNEDIGDLGVLRRYADQRVRDNRVTQGFTDGLIRIFANDIAPLAVARNLGLVAVDLLPPVKRLLVRMTSGMSGRLPRLARGLPL